MVENAVYAWTEGANGEKKSPFSKISGYVTGARKYDHITPILEELHWVAGG